MLLAFVVVAVSFCGRIFGGVSLEAFKAIVRGHYFAVASGAPGKCQKELF